jgi:hypothetical protein
MFNGRYTTDPLRVRLSLIAGAATYAILTVLWDLSHVMWGPIFPGDTFAFVVHFIFWGVISFIFWGVILIVFGLPVGLLLHKLRLRHWLVAVVVGGAITCLVALTLVALLSEFIPPQIDWWGASRNGLILGAGGALVALMMWHIAYRRAVPR